MPSPLRIIFVLIVPALLIFYGGTVVYAGWLYLPSTNGYFFLGGVSARFFGAAVIVFGFFTYLAALEHFSGVTHSFGEPSTYLWVSVLLLFISVVVSWPFL